MTIAAIEDAIISTVKTALGANLRAVDSLPGPWSEATLKQLMRDAPGVYVVWTGGDTAQTGSASAQLTGRWVVYAVTAHASGEKARRRGDGMQIGAYEIVSVVAPLLHNLPIPGEGTLSLNAVQNLFSGDIDRQGVVVYGMEFQMPMTFGLEVAPALLSDFQTFDAQWDVDPRETGAEHRKWLGGDYTVSRPDAEDRVAVPQ